MFSAVVVVLCVATVCLQAVGSSPTAISVQDGHRHEERLISQKEKLESLGCKPVYQVVNIIDHLKEHDDLHDKMFFPQVVAVKRCIESFGFCGHHTLGKTEGRCLPDPEGEEVLRVSLFHIVGGNRNYREMVIKEHSSCKCS